MRRRATLCLLALVAALAAGYAAAADSNPNGVFEGYPVVLVRVNGELVQGDVPAINFKGRTMVPVRFVTEALGGAVIWDAETWTVHIGLVDSTAPPQAPEPPPVATGTDEIVEALGEKIAEVTIEGKVLRFYVTNIEADYELLGKTYTNIYAEIDDDCWLAFLQLQAAGKDAQIAAWFREVGTYAADLCAPARFSMAFFYQDTYSSYPSSYEPDEIRLGDDLKWHVTVLFAHVWNYDGVLRVDVK